MTLDKRIDAWLEENRESLRNLDSKTLYDAAASGIGPVELTEGDPAIRDAIRRRIRQIKDGHGQRMFENVPVRDEDGDVKHRWVQLELASFAEYRAIVDQTAMIGLSVVRKANALAKRAPLYGYQIPLPFPWAEEGGYRTAA